MARSPSTRRAWNPGAKRNDQKTPKRPLLRKHSGAHATSTGASLELGEGALAAALLDLIDLALRVSTYRHRGRTSLLEQDTRVLTSVIRALERHRHAVPVSAVKRRVKVLTPEQEALGYVRLDFDALCKMAVREGFTRKRDAVLVDALWSACQREMPALAAERNNVETALIQLRDPILREKERNGDNDDWLLSNPDPDESNGKKSWGRGTSPIAGDLLRAVVATCKVKPSVSYAPSSTSEYARRLKEAGPALAARATTAAQRLTYMFSLMGVPLLDALWLTHRLLTSRAGQTREGESRSRPLSETNVPRDEAGWSLVRRELARRLVDSGECDANNAEGTAAFVVMNAFPTTSEWSGSEVPVGSSWALPPNPWRGPPVNPR